MVRAPCVIRNKVESCSDKHYNNCWYSDFSSSGAEKSWHQGVVITSGAFTLTSVIESLHWHWKFHTSRIAAQYIIRSVRFLYNKWLPRLIQVFAGRTYDCVGFAVLRRIYRRYIIYCLFFVFFLQSSELFCTAQPVEANQYFGGLKFSFFLFIIIIIIIINE